MNTSKQIASELRVLSATDGRLPVTRASLCEDLEGLGVCVGMLLNVHTAMSQIGWVAGGAQAVIDALLEVLGSTGTLMMPAHTGHLSDPGNWQAPPVPASWWPIIRARMTEFDPDRTPTRGMGTVAESFRSYPYVLRSAHPQVSFTARGDLAYEMTREHPLECMFGERSPMGRLYLEQGHVLLIGVDHGNNSVIHLAEDRADFSGKKHHQEGAPILVDGTRRWEKFRPLQVDEEDFAELGEAFGRETDQEVRGSLGWGTARLMPARAIVDFATPWLESHR